MSTRSCRSPADRAVCLSHAPGQKVPLPVLIRCRHVELLTRPSCRSAHWLPCPTEPARTSAQQNEVVAFESTFGDENVPDRRVLRLSESRRTGAAVTRCQSTFRCNRSSRRTRMLGSHRPMPPALIHVV